MMEKRIAPTLSSEYVKKNGYMNICIHISILLKQMLKFKLSIKMWTGFAY
jgi:hypothetical protein